MQKQVAAPDGDEWRVWIERILLLLGTAQIIAGIFFFFAYNWDDLTHWQKLGLTQGFVVLAALGARVAGLNSLVGKLSLLAAGALVGASFAVYGQIYQTGADAFTLFASWAAVIVGWVLIARFAAFWILWALIVNLALALYLDSVTNLQSTEQNSLLGLLNAAFLVVHEVVRQRVAWLAQAWSRQVLMATCLFLLAVASIDVVAARGWPAFAERPLFYFAIPAFLIASLLSALWSRGHGRDLVGLFIVVLSLSAVAWYAAFRTIDEWIEWEEGLLLIMAVITLAIFGLAGWWLHRTWLQLGSAKQTESGQHNAG